MKRGKTAFIVIILVVVAIGSTLFLLFSKDPVLSAAHGPTRATHSLRAHFHYPETQSHVEVEHVEPDVSDVPMQPPSLPDERDAPFLHEPEVKAAVVASDPEAVPESIVDANTVTPSAETTGLQADTQNPVLDQANEGTDTPLVQKSDNNSALKNFNDGSLEDPAVPPIVALSQPVEEEMPEIRTYISYRGEIPLTKASDGVESFPYLKRYQLYSYREGCISEDTQTSKGDVVRHFKNAIEYGGFCEQNFMSNDIKVMFEAIYNFVDQQTPKLFIELSGRSAINSIAHVVSFTWPSLMVMFHQLPRSESQFDASTTTSLDENIENCHNSLPSNVLTVRGVPSPWVEQMDCFQFIDGYEDYAADILPFELEEMLGQTICRCNITWMPVDLPKTAYFTVWGNSTDLLAAAMRTVLTKCSYSVHVPAKSGYAGRNKPIDAVETHIRVTRITTGISIDAVSSAVSLVAAGSLSKSPYKAYSFGSKSAFTSQSRRSSEQNIDTGAVDSKDNKDASSTDDATNSDLTFQDVLALNLELESKIRLLSAFASADGWIKSREASPSDETETVNVNAIVYKTFNSQLRILPRLYIGLHGEVVGRKVNEVVYAATTGSSYSSGTSRSSKASTLHQGSHYFNHEAAPVVTDAVEINPKNGSSVDGEEKQPDSLSRRLSTLPRNFAENGGGHAGDIGQSGSSISGSVATMSSTPAGSSSSSVFKSPTKRPTFAPPSTQSTSTNSQPTIGISHKNAIVEDVERMFNVAGRTSATSSSVRSLGGGNMFRSKNAASSSLFSEWFFSGDLTNLEKNIVKSQSEENGLFKEWFLLQRSVHNASSTYSFANSLGQPVNFPSVDEMSVLGRVSMKDLRDKERKYLKKWVSTIHQSFRLRSDRKELSKNQLRPYSSIERSGSLSNDNYRDLPSFLSLKKSKIAKSELITIVGRHASMLSIKLAQIQQKGIVVSVHTDPSSISSHSDLLVMFGLGHRNLVCYNKMEVLDVVALSGSQELSAVSIYQSDVVVRLVASSLTSLFPHSPRSDNSGYNNADHNEDDDLFGTRPSLETHGGNMGETAMRCNHSLNLFEESIGVLIDISKTSYIEFPSLDRFHMIVHVLSPECSDEFIGRYADIATIISRSIDAITHHSGIMKVVELPSEGNTSPVVFAVTRSEKGASNTIRPEVGLSLYRMLHLHPSAAVMKTVFQLFLDVPFWLIKSEKSKMMLPWNIFITYRPSQQALGLEYRFPDSSTPTNPFQFEHNYNPMGGTRKGQKLKSAFGVHSQRPGTSFASQSFSQEAAIQESRRAHYLFDIINEELSSRPADLASGKFSFVEHNSGSGYLSSLVSDTYRNATVISLEADEESVAHHVNMLEYMSISNNAVCKKKKGEDSIMFKNIYESPELFRFQVMSRGFLENFRDADNLFTWGADTGSLLSTALTTFVYMPTSEIVSLGMYLFFGSFDKRIDGFGRGPLRPMSELYGNIIADNSQEEMLLYAHILEGSTLSVEVTKQVEKCVPTTNWAISNTRIVMETVSEKVHVWSHPTRNYEDFESSLLLVHSRALAGNTRVKISPLYYGENKLRSPLIRVDIINMTRGVHHHYDYAKDGHKRTYTMHVAVNHTQTAYVSSILGNPSKTVSSPTRNEVTLLSDKRDGSGVGAVALPPGSHPNSDSIVTVNLMRASTIPFYIPYTSIYGVTLITALRLGLETSQRDKMFANFINLPLYEDMAPWNIVLMGSGLDYIDYDTRDITFDAFVPKAYQVMSVLMNYKRTVEDFKRCGSKAPTVYGIAFISDCVGSSKGLKCDELSHAVPCPDGECHTDYISCLRSLTYQANSIAEAGAESTIDVALSAMVAAMASQTGQFDGSGLVS